MIGMPVRAAAQAITAVEGKADVHTLPITPFPNHHVPNTVPQRLFLPRRAPRAKLYANTAPLPSVRGQIIMRCALHRGHICAQRTPVLPCSKILNAAVVWTGRLINKVKSKHWSAD